MIVHHFKHNLRGIQTLQLFLLRYGHHMRGKSPEEARSFKQRMEELNYKDPSIYFKVDIGLPYLKTSRSEELTKRLEVLRKTREGLEREARTKKLLVPLEEVREEWLKTVGPDHIKQVCEHYGVYNDLFGDAYFIPRVGMSVNYKQKDDSCLPVRNGNVIKPSEAATVPEVLYESDSESLWTLILTNPDGSLKQKDAECVHWFIGNIPGNDISKGEIVWNYLQPFPPRGIGFQRLVFILYKQDKQMDYSKLKKEGPCLRLDDRTFNTLEFYRERQDDITPAGLAFFQCDWDSSLTDFFHNVLEMEEPIYEYDFPPPHIRRQRYFPLRQPFNSYMDKYRDPKQINKEYLMKKMKNIHPFKTPEPAPMFPNAFPLDNKKIPSWLRVEMKRDRLGWGRINDV